MSTTTAPKTKMQYGEHTWRADGAGADDDAVVRLGNSGLKVSKIILGCMSYGLKTWQDWVLDEDEALKHIKFACVVASCPLFPVCAG